MIPHDYEASVPRNAREQNADARPVLLRECNGHRDSQAQDLGRSTADRMP
jgi:hypothetical protein